MSAHVIERVGSPVARLSLRAQQVMWLGAGLVFGFLVSFVFADVLELPRDLFYGIYAALVLTFFVAWAKSTGQSFGGMLRRRWLLAIALGLVVAGVMAFIVLRTEDETARPDGIELVAAVLWRGVVYGLTDGLLLSAFPILVVFAASRPDSCTRPGSSCARRSPACGAIVV